MAKDDRIPEEPNLGDPFWQVIFGAANAEMDACERGLIIQKQKDDEWYRETRKQLQANGLVGQAFADALKQGIGTYFAQPRARCICGQHREGGLRQQTLELITEAGSVHISP